MSMPQEVGKVAATAIDAMKTSPSLLALIFLQCATLAVLYFVNDKQNERRATREIMMIERCFPHADKLKTLLKQAQETP